MENKIDLNKIIEKMPKDLTDIEKARYIYIELCKIFIYDEKYVTGDQEVKHTIFEKEPDVDNIEDNEIVCSSLSRLCIQMLEKVGIKAAGIYMNGRYEGHMAVVMQIGEGENKKYYHLNPTTDLMEIKQGFKTMGFCSKPLDGEYLTFAEDFSTISEEEIKTIDDKLGYTYNGLYMDEVINMLSEEMCNIQYIREYIKIHHPEIDVTTVPTTDFLKYKLEFLVNYINNFCKDLSGTEKRDLIYTIAETGFTDDENKKFGRFHGKESNKLIAILKAKGQVREDDVFYLIQDSGDIVNINEEEVRTLLENGLELFRKDAQIISKDNPFDEVNKQFNTKLNIYTGEHPEAAYAAILLQCCKRYISHYQNGEYYKHFSKKRLNMELEKAFEVFKQYEEYFKKMPEEIRITLQNKIDECVSLYNMGKENDTVPDKRLYELITELEGYFSEEAKEIVQMTEDYKKLLIQCAKDKNILLTHISPCPPEKMENQVIRPNYRPSQYGSEFGNYVFACSEDNSTNTYLIARANNSGMRLLPNIYINPIYLLGADNIDIIRDDDQKPGRVASKEPGYIYYIKPEGFTPEVELMVSTDYISNGTLHFNFGDEWKYNGEIELPEKSSLSQVTKIEEFTDVTQILESNQILTQKIPLTEEEIECLQNTYTVRKKILELLEAGKIRYLNGESGVNSLNIRRMNIPDKSKKVMITAKDALEAHCITAEDVRREKTRLDKAVELIKNPQEQTKDKVDVGED